MSFQIIKLHNIIELTKIACQICLNENYNKKEYNYILKQKRTTIFPLITKHVSVKVYLVTEN